MSKFKFRRPTPGFILAAVALFVAMGGGAYAASIGTSDLKNNAVTKKKIAGKAVSGAKIKKGAVKTNKLADEGVTNSKLGHPSYWAYVNNSGSLVRSNGATSTSTIGTGHRTVQFETDVSECSYVATGKYQEGFGRLVNAEVDPSNGTKVRVRIRDGKTGAATNGNSDFSLAVLC